MNNKELFIALLGNKDLALPKEIDNSISLFTSKVDLEYIMDVLHYRNPNHNEVTGDGETLVGAFVTHGRILTIVHRNRPTNYQGSNGYIGSSYLNDKDENWFEFEAYAWNEEYEVSETLAAELEKRFGCLAYLK